MADNNLRFSDNYKIHLVDAEEFRLMCVDGTLVFSSIDYPAGQPVSLATLIEAAKEYEQKERDVAA